MTAYLTIAIRQQGNELISRQGAAEKITLALSTVPRLEKTELRLALDPFCNHPQLETVAHADDCTDDDSAIGFIGDITHKGLVNFKHVNRKLLQISQAGIARTEVVYRQSARPCSSVLEV